jgi:hypothetical protein
MLIYTQARIIRPPALNTIRFSIEIVVHVLESDMLNNVLVFKIFGMNLVYINLENA